MDRALLMVLSIFFNSFCAVPIYKRRKGIKIKSFKHCLPRALPAFLLQPAWPRLSLCQPAMKVKGKGFTCSRGSIPRDDG